MCGFIILSLVYITIFSVLVTNKQKCRQALWRHAMRPSS